MVAPLLACTIAGCAGGGRVLADADDLHARRLDPADRVEQAGLRP